MPKPTVPAVRRRLLSWYDANARDLPWRRRPGPYATLVSELMLQQTRIATVLPYYERWIKRWPTVEALAAAKASDVLAMWSGLGYYRRARHLHAAAKHVAQHGWPRTAEGLHDLPGVGAYTGAAIASIAFGDPAAAVDGNVVRVLARLDATRGFGPAVERKVRRRAAELVDPARPGDWNQAVMDLGATLCTPRAPRCSECPLKEFCLARRQNLQDRIPPPKRAARPRSEPRHVALVERRGRILLVEGNGGLLDGMWMLPGGGPRRGLAKRVLAQTGVEVLVGPVVRRVSHAFSHKTWDVAVHAVERPVARPGRLPAGARWVSHSDLGRLAVPAVLRKALARKS